MSVLLAPLLNPPTPFRGIDNSQAIIRVYFTVTPAGNYAALGDTMDFTSLGDLIKSDYAPLLVVILSAKSGGASGFLYSYNPGTTMANGKFQLLAASGNAAGAAPFEDFPAGAYPAAVLADTIVGFADFIRL